jgi:hypothetical protein
MVAAAPCGGSSRRPAGVTKKLVYSYREVIVEMLSVSLSYYSVIVFRRRGRDSSMRRLLPAK